MAAENSRVKPYQGIPGYVGGSQGKEEQRRLTVLYHPGAQNERPLVRESGVRRRCLPV